MNDSQCMARLLASGVHDMRNVLAVIRESAGLAQDMAALAGAARPRGERLLAALTEVQSQILQGAALAEGMEFMAQAGGAENENAGPCDLARVCRIFCRMAARQARAAQMRLVSGENEEPVWAPVPPLEVLRSLLEIFDLCASVGGQVTLKFTAGRQQKAEGVIIEVVEGANADLALSALTGSPLLNGLRPGWQAVLMPWRDAGGRFFLSLAARDSESN